jgi:two-component system KDP operon response regulator KdpE
LSIDGHARLLGAKEAAPVSVRFRRPLILVVDEDETLPPFLRGILAPEGFGVVNAPDGKAALDRLGTMHEPPRLILLDPETPLMSASELLTVLASDARYARVPVVLLSRQARDLRIPLHDSVVAHLAIPFPIEELIDLVRRHARSSRRRVVPAEARRSG